MATMKGRDDVSRYIESIPPALQTKILRGAARAAARVVADEAKARSISAEVSEAVKVSTRQENDSRVIAKVKVKGPGSFIAPWLEYGTDPHFVSVDDSQRRGMSVRTVNRRAKEAGEGGHSLVIGGKFVGTTVFHPGAKPHPFLRPSLDIKQGEAIAAAQTYVTTRIAREGLGGADVPEAEE